MRIVRELDVLVEMSGFGQATHRREQHDQGQQPGDEKRQGRPVNPQYSFDCSGLVQYVYKQLGKSLPRTTDQQVAATVRISRGSEQPGDLIFFGEPGSIYHEGIYAGDGQIWVAPKSGDVVKLEPIWTSSYYVGRVP
ncbi:hypothetical protein BCD48_31930 [Pseudofrankia sp. BMG5.36]|nr:hypothetical protein BCD48_31930 [Pseudofrankia sp. BMG5.36]